MKPRYRFPSRLEDIQMEFFGRFTWRDILRIGLPILTTEALAPSGIQTAVLHLIPGLILGTVLYLARPFGHPLDHHAYHLVRFLLKRWRK